MSASAIIPVVNSITGRGMIQSREFIDSLKGKFDRYQINQFLRGNVSAAFRADAMVALEAHIDSMDGVLQAGISRLTGSAKLLTQTAGFKFVEITDSEAFSELFISYSSAIKGQSVKVVQRFSDALRDRQFRRFLTRDQFQNEFASQDLNRPKIADAMGRKVLASDIMERTVRWLMLTYYNEVIVLQAAENNLTLVVDHFDPTHESNEVRFAPGDHQELPGYFEIKDAMFHPRSSAVVRFDV